MKAIPKVISSAIEDLVDGLVDAAILEYLLESFPRMRTVRAYRLFNIGVALDFCGRWPVEGAALRKRLMVEARKADTRWRMLRAVEAAEAMVKEWDEVLRTKR